MMNNKFIKFLVILNGILLPFLLFFGIYQITKEMIPYKNNNDGVIVGKKFEEAKKDNVALQGLKYDNPEKIYNSKNYLLKVSLLSYNEQKKINNFSSSSNELNDSFFKYINVIFLNKDYQVIGSLLDKKASILEVKYKKDYYRKNKPEENPQKNIGYLIGLYDTNNDGNLNSNDNHDLYISNLSGQNLKKVTENIDIEKFNFINSNTQILIHYKERKDIPEEHKKTKFAIYNIQKEIFVDLQGLNVELDKLEKIIIN